MSDAIAYEVSPIAHAFWGVAKQRPSIAPHVNPEGQEGWLVDLVEPVYREVFSRLYEDAPQIEQDAPHPRRIFHDALHEALHSAPSWPRLIEAVRGDYLMASCATAELIGVLAQMPMPEMPDSDGDIDNSDDKTPDFGNPSPDDADEDGQGDSDGETDEPASSPMEQAIQDWLEGQQGDDGMDEAGAEQAIGDAMDAAEQAKSLAGLLGGEGDSRPGMSSIAPEEAERLLALARQIKAGGMDLHKFISLIGRLKAAMDARRAEIKTLRVKQGTSLRGVTPGDDFARLIPTEKNLFAAGGVHALRQAHRLLTQETLCYAFDAPEEHKANQGPFVLLLDVSGSTQRILTDLKAFAIALCAIAHEEGRMVAVVAFNDHASLIAEPDISPFERAGRILSLSSNGGTNFLRPLRLAYEVIEEGMVGHGADVLLLSDGQCGVRSERRIREFIEHDAPSEIRHHCMLIGQRVLRAPYKPLFDARVVSVEGVEDIKGLAGASVGAAIGDIGEDT